MLCLAPWSTALLWLVLQLNEAQASPRATLTTGVFQGSTTSNGTDRWLGIPYAQAPVGSLRFKAPVAISTTARGVQDATTFGNACPQVPASTLGAPIGEDCLFLNVCNQAKIL